MANTTTIIASIPKCDMCGKRPAYVDGKTLYGPWAYMCQPCWIIRGVGKLGTGFGQVLELDK